MTRACSGCGLRSCNGRCYDESPDGTMCARCNDQPAIEGEALCIYCAPDAAAEYAELTEVHGDPLLGDCPLGTVATRASPRAPAGLGHSASVNYRKDEAA